MQPQASTDSLPLDLQTDLALIVLSILGTKGEGLPRDRAFWAKADGALSRMRELGLDRAKLFRPAGPNHKPDCDGATYSHSGTGYGRVRVCLCGAEDHDPE